MTGALVALVCLTQCVAGWLVWTSVGGSRSSIQPGTLGRALVLGPAAITLQMIAYGFSGIPLDLLWILTPWWVATVFALRGGMPTLRLLPRGYPAMACTAIAALLLVLAFLVGAQTPVYISDAMYNYALPAKMIAAHGGFAEDLYKALTDPGQVHYPPLICMNEALIFMIDPERGAWLIQPLSTLGLLAFFLLLGEAVWNSDRTGWSSLAFLIVVFTPQLSANVIEKLVDVRLLATLLFVALEAQRLRRGGSTANPTLLAVAAIAAGLTKHEGYVIAGGACAFLWIHGLRSAVPVLRRGVLPIVLLVGVWPTYVVATGIAAVSPIMRLSIAPEHLLAGVQHLPGVALGLFLAMFEYDSDGVSRWGVVWAVALVLAGWLLASTKREGVWLVPCLWVAHFGLTAYVVAVTIASNAVDGAGVGIAVDFAKDRVLLLQLVWVIVLLGYRRAVTARA